MRMEEPNQALDHYLKAKSNQAINSYRSKSLAKSIVNVGLILKKKYVNASNLGACVRPSIRHCPLLSKFDQEDKLKGYTL